MTISIQLVGLTEFEARLSRMPQTVWAQIVIAMDGIVDRLANTMRDRMGALFRDPARMQASVATNVDDGPPVVGTVGAYGLPYLQIQEYGGVTSPHDIFPVNAQVLAFLMPGGALPFKGEAETGGTVFARVVHHPGSRIPERSYARSALAMERSNILSDLFDAVDAARQQ